MTFPFRVGHNSVFIGNWIYILLEVLILIDEPYSIGSVFIFFVKEFYFETESFMYSTPASFLCTTFAP